MKSNKLLLLVAALTIALSSIAFVNPTTNPKENIRLKEDGKISFAEFLSHFDKVDNTFEIGLDDFKHYENILKSKKVSKKVYKTKKRITNGLMDHLVDVEFGMYSRMGPPEILPVARFYPNEKSVAVIYIPYRALGGHSVASYKMALFDLKGNPIIQAKHEDKLYKESFSAAFTNFHTAITFKMDGQGHIWQKEYEKIWLKDIKEHGMKDNEVIGYNLKSTHVFEIHEDGLVSAMKEYPVDDRASIK